MNQGGTTFKTILDGGFLQKFFEKIKNIDTPKIGLTRDSDWEVVTAFMFKWYLTKETWEEDHIPDLLNYFIVNSERNDTVTKDNIQEMTSNIFPEPKYYDITIGNASLFKIMQHIHHMTLEYILHLAYTIRKLEKEQVNEPV
jgi:hypothetical protein